MAASDDPGEPSRVEAAAVDDTGQLWAASIPDDHLHTLAGAIWKTVAFTPADGAEPLALFHFHDGSPVCIWTRHTVKSWQYFATEHSGTSSKLIGSIRIPPGTYPAPQMAVDSKDNVWIVERNGVILRIARTGKADAPYTIPAERFYIPNPSNPSGSYNELCLTEAPDGKIWFWGRTAAINSMTMRGVLVFDGTQFIDHPTLQGMPANCLITCMFKTAVGKMEAACEPTGLFEIDPKTIQAAALPDPTGGALKYVVAAFTTGAAHWYVTGNRVFNALWREQDGKWTKVLDPFHAVTTGECPHLETTKGVLLGPGLWFLPADGSAPSHVNWSCGVPLADATTLLSLSDGRSFLAKDGRYFLGRLDLPPVQVSGAVRTFEARHILLDKKGHGWSILTNVPGSLSEWDGEKWITHTIPNGGADAYQLQFIDSQDRYWILPNQTHTLTQIFDPRSRQWLSFRTFEEAALSTLSQPADYTAPRIGRSKDGRVGFVRAGAVYYFDGKTWHQWDDAQVRHKANTRVFDRVGFDDKGQMFVQSRAECDLLTGTGTWQDITGTPAAPPAEVAPLVFRDKVQSLLSAKLMEPDISSCAKDPNGVVWYPREGHLYKALGDLSAPAFQPSQPDPFADQRFVMDAQIDCRGNVFMRTPVQTSFQYVLAPAVSVPIPKVMITAIDGDAVTVQFSAEKRALTHGGAKKETMPWYSYSLDGGGWSKPSSCEWLTMHLTDSDAHVIQVKAIDAHLNFSKASAAVPFKVDRAQEKLVGGEVETLLRADDKAAAAITEKLCLAAPVSLPALKEAAIRATTHEQAQVLQTAIQQAERTLAPFK